MLTKNMIKKPTGTICNMSLRKTHTQVLNKAFLPASVQQRSLGHGSNYWKVSYNDGEDRDIQEQVATTINNTLFAMPQTPPMPAANQNASIPAPKKMKTSSNSPPNRIETISDNEARIMIRDFKYDLPKGALVKVQLPSGVCFELIV
jgi:hypothetical protein